MLIHAMFGSHDHGDDPGNPRFSRSLISRFKSMFKDSVERGNKSVLIYEDIPNVDDLNDKSIGSTDIIIESIDNDHAAELLYADEDFINNVLLGNVYKELLTFESLEAIKDYVISSKLYELLSEDLRSGAKNVMPIEQFSNYMYFISKLTLSLSAVIRDAVMVHAIKFAFEDPLDQLFIIRGTGHKESLPRFLEEDGFEVNVEFDPEESSSLRTMKFPLIRLIADKVLELRKEHDRWPLLYSDYLALLRLIPHDDLISALNENSRRVITSKELANLLKILDFGEDGMSFLFAKAVELSRSDGELSDEIRNL